MIRAALFVVLCGGCSASVMPTCDWAHEPIDDEGALRAGMSVDSVLADMGRPAALLGEDAQQQRVSVTWSVTRGEGQALFREGTPGEERIGSPLATQTNQLLVYVECTDHLAVPARVQVVAPDVPLEVQVDGELLAFADSRREFTAERQVRMPGIALPDGPWNEDPDATVSFQHWEADGSEDDRTSMIVVHWTEGGEPMSEALLWW